MAGGVELAGVGVELIPDPTSSTNLVVGTTTITGGSNGNILYDNGGVLGEKTTTGSGAVVLANTPTLITPSLGVATGTSLALGGATLGGNALAVTGTSAFSGQISSSLAIGTAPFSITSTTLVPNLYVARAVLADSATTNANLTGPITSVGNATSIASQTGTGTKFVVDTSPTLVTPNIGVATGTSLALNGATIGSNAVASIGQFASYGATTTGPGFYAYLNGDTLARVRIGLDANDMPSLAFGAGGASTRDTFILRAAAASLQFGQTDVDTAPVAQTTRTQGTLAGGTSNVAGANWTLIASPGKGTGVGGSFLFQTAPAGSTGTTVNVPVTALTIDSTQRATFSAGITNSGNGAASISQSLWNGTVLTGGTATTNFPAMFVQPTGTSAVTSWSTSGTGLGMNLASGFAGNFLDFHAGGAVSVFSINSGGTASIGGNALVNGNVQIANSSLLNWAGRGILTSPAAGSIQFGNTDAAVAVAQTIRVQSVIAGTAAANGANWTLIGSLPTGTGTSGDIIVQTGVKTGSGTTQGTPTTALTIKGETQAVIAAGTFQSKDLRTSKTANYSVLASDTGTQFDNIGASGEVDFTLPTAAIGLKYGFTVKAAQVLKVIAGSSTIIAIGASISASAGNIQANTAYSSVQLEAISTTEWVATSGASGSWTVT